MSLIIWNILAYLALIAIVGLIGVSIWMAATILAIVHRVKTLPALIEAPRKSILQTVRIVNGLGVRAKNRALAIGGHATVAAQAVVSVKNDVVEIVESLHVDEVRAGVQETAEGMRSGIVAINLIRQILEAARSPEARGDTPA